MKFTIPNKKFTGRKGGFDFVEGVCEVPDADAANAEAILCRYHGAEKLAEAQEAPKSSDAPVEDGDGKPPADEPPPAPAAPSKAPAAPSKAPAKAAAKTAGK